MSGRTATTPSASATQPETLLAAVPLFAGLPAELVKLVLQCALRRHYPRQAEICYADDPTSLLFILLSGHVSLSVQAPEGASLGVTTLAAPDWFGDFSLLDGSHQPTTVTALTAVEALVLARPTLRDLIGRHPDLALHLLAAAHRRLRDVLQHLTALHGGSAQVRVARALLDLATKHGEPRSTGLRLCVRMTHADVAALTGLTRETVTTVFTVFRERGAVFVDADSRWTIRTPRLARFAGAANAADGAIDVRQQQAKREERDA